jgi:NAD kinase
MLVDIFCDPIIFSTQQGSEMDQIFKEAFEKYAISESKMLRYASRRRRKQELDTYLNEVSKYRHQ